MDMVKELRLRRWARENYVPVEERSPDWDAVILDEMQIRDEDFASIIPRDEPGSKLVPLEPATFIFDTPHLGPTSPHFLSKPEPRSSILDSEWSCHFG
jgi:hypothetical protein